MEHEPLLVMEYLPLGNLACQHALTEEETLQILNQGLQALEYLHSQTPPVAHRDMKPKNILVQSRTPFVIKLVDFGLAKTDSSLKTFCGSEPYTAPEIWERRHYTTLVDIWSLGVIVLEYVYGLPTQHSQARTKGEVVMKVRGLAWCRHLVKFANDWDSDPLIDLLTKGMLRMEAPQRLSAGACLTKADELGLFDKPTASSERTILTQPTVLTSGMRNEEETPTVIVGAVWDAARDGLNYGGAVEARRFASDRRSTTSTSRQLGAPRPRDDEGPIRLRKGPSEAAPDRSSGHVRLSLEPSRPPAAKSMRLGTKRHRSPAVSPPGHPSDKSLVKRRPAEARLTEARSKVAPESLRHQARPLLGTPSAQAGTVPSIETETLSPKRNICNDTKGTRARNLDRQHEGEARVHHP